MFEKIFHPIGVFAYFFTNTFLSVNSAHKTIKQNCLTLRGEINTYIQKRKSGEIKSKVAENVDLLSLFMNTPDIFTDDFIIDELMDFFLAGTQTTQFATQTIVQYLSKTPGSLAKVRNEFANMVLEN